MTSFSIAIPVYEQQKFIPTALKSIQVQDATYELAVMDATPNHSIQHILDEYKDIISYRRHGPDGGQSEAIIEGWDNISGDIIAWLCADDYYFPDTLSRVQEIFEQNPDVDVVYGDSVYVDANDCFKTYFPSIESDVSCLPIHDCIAQPSCFVRRSAFERVGGLNIDLHYIMDWELWTRLYKSGCNFYYLKRPLSVTRIYPETKTSGMSFERYREINHHLKQQPSTLRRAVALLGTWQFDLSENKRNIFMNVAFLTINAAQRVKSFVVPKKQKELYGLGIGSNLVVDSCSILLPWYHEAPPKQVVLSTAPSNIPVLLFVDGEQIIGQVDNGEQLFRLSENIKGASLINWEFTLQVERPISLTSFELK